MKKEILKGLTMVMLTVVLALVSAVASANAQSSNRVVASIPFEFVVGGQTMPAGEYVATASTQNGALRILSADAKSSAIRLTNSIEPQRNKTNARLVFHRYGERYFLAEVWSGSDSAGCQLLKSRQERATERELASISTRFETIEVLAKAR
ncbi:MAG: hypothetical protein ACREA9_29640 [Pyrinomonadaceae bacterium]